MQGNKMFRKLIFPLILCLSVTHAQTGYLRALGPNIVDGTNQPILLRGIGLGGWLVPEGYMLKVPGYGSPTDIETKIRDLIGDANSSQFYSLYRANYVNRTDIALIAQWGFNSIRLPFHYKIVYNPDNGTFREEGFAIFDSLLAWCETAGMFVILDMHCAPGGQNKDNISDSDGIEARLWTNPTNQTLTIRIWKEIARRYAARTIVAGYDLLNEPVLPPGYSNTVLKNLYKQITDTIRTVDPHHIVFIEGNWYATDFNLLTPPFVSNMVYAFHKYWNETSFSTIQYLVSIRNQYFVPLWLGESGENSNPWFHEVTRLCEQNNIGWNWWTHKKLETITSPLSARIGPEYQTVLNYWNGQAPRPTEAFATSALFGMAQNLALHLCVPRPDVLKSLTDPAFGTTLKPYKSLAIPGIIDAVDYDFGTEGVAYHDTDYKNVGGSNTEYNKGYDYRNDGVDIDVCNDTQGAPYYVGWIASGEWIRYTVDVATGGLYRADLRVAAPSTGGQIQFSIDGVPVTSPVSVSATGGWTTWAGMAVNNIPMPAGQHVLTVTFPSAGFNLNRMQFVLVSADVREVDSGIPDRFELLQNYPNPFNPSTRIPFAIRNSGLVSLFVFDVLGREVARLVHEELRPGTYEAMFDASSLASGVYVCRLQTEEFSQSRKLLLMR